MCITPGCSEICEEHGTCNYNYGECTCGEGFYGIDCNIGINLDYPAFGR